LKTEKERLVLKGHANNNCGIDFTSDGAHIETLPDETPLRESEGRIPENYCLHLWVTPAQSTPCISYQMITALRQAAPMDLYVFGMQLQANNFWKWKALPLASNSLQMVNI
jgi:hypothetical protein